MRPNFFIIGAPKAATTSLSSLLGAHPQAGIAKGKEPHFFSIPHIYRQGWNEYLKQFSHCDRQQAVGDASTSYSRIRYFPLTIERIHKHVPEAKIIYQVRHPVKRMESAYFEHLCTNRRVFSSINDAVRRQSMLLDSSRYWEVFDAYRQVFGESRIKIVWFEEYVKDQTKVFKDVCQFLKIDSSLPPSLDVEDTNSRNNAPARMARLGRQNVKIDTEWEPDTRQWVIDELRDDNCRFLSHFGRPLDYWRNLY
jgi:hypothetical protein